MHKMTSLKVHVLAAFHFVWPLPSWRLKRSSTMSIPPVNVLLFYFRLNTATRHASQYNQLVARYGARHFLKIGLNSVSL